MSTTIHLGYAVGTGEPVSIPLAHTAITGQTQSSGKTTTLEALVGRATRPAIAFVTKRGEGSFQDGHRIQPYFRDRADWQFVDRLLEAQLAEKNKYLRQFIIPLCRTTKTLAEVWDAVRKALPKARGKVEGAYVQLDAYLELIVPEIARAKLADRLELVGPGLHVMDVSGYARPMQMLFVQSAIDWVNEREHGVTVIVPEAWEFIPQGKGSPVKASAEILVRKGAGIGNLIWVDSQDMAGVDNIILRGCTVWLIGVQREANEIKRALANIPTGIAKPKAADVALLERGQFFVCYGRHAIKTYVQPAWMAAADAQAVAQGTAPAPVVQPRTFFLNEQHETHAPKRPVPEDPSMCQEHARLQADLKTATARLQEQGSELAGARQSIDTLMREVVDLRTAGEAAQLIKLGVQALLGSAPAIAVGGTTAVDEEALVQKVIARIPAGGTVVQVTPPAKLRANFQQAEVDRLLRAVRELEPLPRQVLKLLEAVEGGYLTQPTIAARLGRSYRGGAQQKAMSNAVDALVKAGLTTSQKGHGARTILREKIAEDLAAYQPTDADVEATYQRVLYELATAESAAA
jgi:hypothetical protein